MTTATPVNEDILETETVSMEIGIKVPFLEDNDVEPKRTVSIKDIQLKDDGSLHITCLAQASSNEIEDEGASPMASPTQASNGSESISEKDADTQLDTPAKETTDAPSTIDSPPDSEQQADDEEQAVSEQNIDLDQPSDDKAESIGDETDDTVDSPAYRDPDQLQAVYDEYSTFSEMTDALDVDVTPQTVRRYMIKHGIHEPAPNTGSSSIDILLEADPDSFPPLNSTNNSEDEEEENQNQPEVLVNGEESTAMDGGTDRKAPVVESEDPSSVPMTPNGDGEMRSPSKTNGERDDRVDRPDSASPEANPPSDSQTESDTSKETDNATPDIPDDIELPDHLTLEEVKEAVRDAKTLYEVKKKLKMDRDQARNLLQELNLLDLVQGRLSTREFQERTLEDINRRIHSASRKEV